MNKSIILIFLLSFSILNANINKEDIAKNQKNVFETYCWGCHHQTSMAFGPSFQEIANKRTIAEIKGHIISPKSTYKLFGYKRSVMPSFANILTDEQLDLIANYIKSYKGKK